MDSAILRQIEEYRETHWDDVMRDIESLVRIASVEDLASASVGAPFGPGPRQALDQALAIATRMGFEVHDCEGHIGFADLPGADNTQIGIIGHVDVVAAGPGWSCEPFAITRRDGYLLGRGVIDDKGPLVVALHALKFWKDRIDSQGGGSRLPYSVRVLFGVNEETNMKDVEYYRAHFKDPAFLFTPDSQFPVGYGESGICSGTLVSAPIVDGRVLELHGGQAVNAVAGMARAIVRSDEELLGSDEIEVERHDEGVYQVVAHGMSAHAMDPSLGRNAIGILVNYFLEKRIGSSEEQAFFHLLKKLHDHSDGSSFNIQCSDEHFGALSMVGGVIDLREGRIFQSLDFRYPTTTTSTEIERGVRNVANEIGAAFTIEHDKEPFLMDPDSPAVRALLDAYGTVTGDKAKGLVSKGGTYARCFTTGVSFGVEKPWEDDPDWVGGMHGPDEGVSEDLLKQAFSVYALALGNLMEVKLE